MEFSKQNVSGPRRGKATLKWWQGPKGRRTQQRKSRRLKKDYLSVVAITVSNKATGFLWLNVFHKNNLTHKKTEHL